MKHSRHLLLYVALVVNQVHLVLAIRASQTTASARCWNSDKVELYLNAERRRGAENGDTLTFSVDNDVEKWYIGPTTLLAFGCCTKSSSSSSSSSSPPSNYGMVFSSVYDRVLVTDIDWRCVHSEVWMTDFYHTTLNDSLWQEAYVIDSYGPNNTLDDGRFEPYAKWIWAHTPTGDIPPLRKSTPSRNCAFCRANSIAKFQDAPVMRIMVLSKSSVELGTTPQLIHGMDLESFQFTLELYTSSASEIGLENETVGCVSGGKLVFIPCHNTSSGKQIVVHMGIGGTNSSELRICDAESTTSCNVLATSATNPLRCRQYQYFWAHITASRTIEVGLGRRFDNQVLLSAVLNDDDDDVCAHITHIQLMHENPTNPIYIRVHRNTSRDEERILGENECLVLPHELHTRQPCGDGYPMTPDECIQYHCCYMWEDADKDSDSAIACYAPMQSVQLQGSAAAYESLRYDVTMCTRTFSDVIGDVNFTASQKEMTTNTQLTFFIWLQRVVRNVSVTLDFGDGTSTSNISFKLNNYEDNNMYHFASVSHLYICPSVRQLEPSIEIRGPLHPIDVVTYTETLTVVEKDCLIFCNYSNSSFMNVSFAIFTDVSHSRLNVIMDFGDGNVRTDFSVADIVTDLPDWAEACRPPGYQGGMIHHSYESFGTFEPNISIRPTVCPMFPCSYRQSIDVGTFEDFKAFVGIPEPLVSLSRVHSTPGVSASVNVMLATERFHPDLMVSLDFGDGTIISDIQKVDWSSGKFSPGTMSQYTPQFHTYNLSVITEVNVTMKVEHRRMQSWLLFKTETIKLEDVPISANAEDDTSTPMTNNILRATLQEPDGRVNGEIETEHMTVISDSPQSVIAPGTSAALSDTSSEEAPSTTDYRIMLVSIATSSEAETSSIITNTTITPIETAEATAAAITVTRAETTATTAAATTSASTAKTAASTYTTAAATSATEITATEATAAVTATAEKLGASAEETITATTTAAAARTTAARTAAARTVAARTTAARTTAARTTAARTTAARTTAARTIAARTTAARTTAARTTAAPAKATSPVAKTTETIAMISTTQSIADATKPTEPALATTATATETTETTATSTTADVVDSNSYSITISAITATTTASDTATYQTDHMEDTEEMWVSSSASYSIDNMTTFAQDISSYKPTKRIYRPTTKRFDIRNLGKIFTNKSTSKPIYPLEAVTFYVVADRDMSAVVDFGDGTQLGKTELLNRTNLSKSSVLPKELGSGPILMTTHRYNSSGLFQIRATIFGKSRRKRFTTTARLSVRKYNAQFLVKKEKSAEDGFVDFVIFLPSESTRNKKLLVDFGDGSPAEELVLEDFKSVPVWAALSYRQPERNEVSATVSHEYTAAGTYEARLILKDKSTAEKDVLQSVIAVHLIKIATLQEALDTLEIDFHSDENNAGTLLLWSEYSVSRANVRWVFGNTSSTDDVIFEKVGAVPSSTPTGVCTNQSSAQSIDELLAGRCNDVTPCYAAVVKHSFENSIPSVATVTLRANTKGNRTASISKLIVMNNSSWDQFSFGVLNTTAENNSASYRSDQEIVLRADYPTEVHNDALVSSKCTVTGEKEHRDICVANVLHNGTKNLLELTIPANTLQPGSYAIDIQGEFVDKYGILRTVTTKSLIVVTPALLVASFPATETPALLVASFPATETPALLVASFQTTQTPALLLASLQASKHLYTVNETLLLDAGNSMDPNFNNSVEGLEYQWTCSKSQTPFASATAIDKQQNGLEECLANHSPVLLSSTQPLLQLPISSLNLMEFPATFHFRVLVSKAGMLQVNSSASVTINVISGAKPSFQIVCLENCNDFISYDTALVLTFDCRNCGDGEQLVKRWTVGKEGNEDYSDRPRAFPLGSNGTLFQVEAFALRLIDTETEVVTLTVTRVDKTSDSASLVLALPVGGTTDSASPVLTLPVGDRPTTEMEAFGQPRIAAVKSSVYAKNSGSDLRYLTLLFLILPAIAIGAWIRNRKRNQVGPRDERYLASQPPTASDAAPQPPPERGYP